MTVPLTVVRVRVRVRVRERVWVRVLGKYQGQRAMDLVANGL